MEILGKGENRSHYKMAPNFAICDIGKEGGNQSEWPWIRLLRPSSLNVTWQHDLYGFFGSTTGISVGNRLSFQPLGQQSTDFIVLNESERRDILLGAR